MPVSLINPFRRNYEPLNRIEISREALSNNYQYLSRLNKNLKIAPVLKSNAYGHGINLTAKILDRISAPFFCVDSLFEAYQLSKININTPILVMGYFDPLSLKTKRLPFSFAVFTKEQLFSIIQNQPQAKIHLFVDTGMHREGIPLAELKNYFTIIGKNKLCLEGLMTHLAQSDKPEDKQTENQLKIFGEARKIAYQMNFFPKWFHLGNSETILRIKHYRNNEIGNLVRSGIALYGIDPSKNNDKLKPVLNLKTKISQIKEILPGEGVGYDFTFRAKEKTEIAVLPIGYADGVDRRLSSLGAVKINHKYCPIIGRVSMNITTIDVSGIKNFQVGQEVVVFSDRPEDINSIRNSAKIAKTIPYDLLTGLNPTIKRIII